MTLSSRFRIENSDLIIIIVIVIVIVIIIVIIIIMSISNGFFAAIDGQNLIGSLRLLKIAAPSRKKQRSGNLSASRNIDNDHNHHAELCSAFKMALLLLGLDNWNTNNHWNSKGQTERESKQTTITITLVLTTRLDLATKQKLSARRIVARSTPNQMGEASGATSAQFAQAAHLARV